MEESLVELKERATKIIREQKEREEAIARALGASAGTVGDRVDARLASVVSFPHACLIG
jgi:hypothetical protein